MSSEARPGRGYRELIVDGDRFRLATGLGFLFVVAEFLFRSTAEFVTEGVVHLVLFVTASYFVFTVGSALLAAGDE